MSAMQHDLAAELRYQLYQTALSMVEALGSWESIVLAEQYETICRFLDHPHAVPAARAPWRGQTVQAAWIDEIHHER